MAVTPSRAAVEALVQRLADQPIPWAGAPPDALGMVHGSHIYYYACAICRSGERQEALTAVVGAVLELASRPEPCPACGGAGSGGGTAGDDWVAELGPLFVAQCDRLWPDETQIDSWRLDCLVEEAVECLRAVTKRRHARNASDGICKGLTVEEWDRELAGELGQLVGVAIDIAHREGIDLQEVTRQALEALQRREPGT